MSGTHLLSVSIFIGGLLGVATARANGAPATARSPPAGNLVKNADFRDRSDNKPAGFDLTGDVVFRYLGDETHGGPWCLALESAARESADDVGERPRHGSVSQMVTGLNAAEGRWFRFTIRGLPGENFAVEEDGLDMKIEFFQGDAGFDGKVKRLYSIIQQQRKDLSVNGDQRIRGAAAWHTYQLDLMLPSPLVDRVRLTVEFDHAKAAGNRYSQFLITDMSLVRIDGPGDSGPANGTTAPANQRPENLIPIGGRFFYRADAGEKSVPARFDHTNGDRLIYHDNRWSAPFAGAMSAWLRAGDLDLDGNVVREDRFIPDNVTVSFDRGSMIIHTHGLPNHPTGKFPGENPNYIQEKDATYNIPLNPKENPEHVAIDLHNTNRALNMGPIGIAANGVVFFNPFDAGNSDASNMMDYCCGHPAPDNTYHYHKYPICMNSPWADEGKEHSPLLGWAFDGFPIYGPYASAGMLAKDLKGHEALNEFNLHTDADRGPHYQVTPGKFPYIISGYWGTPEPRDIRRGRRPGDGPGGGPGAGGGPG
jgi:hypothetical protein